MPDVVPASGGAEIDPEAMRGRITELRADIRALGPVNIDAMEDLLEERERVGAVTILDMGIVMLGPLLMSKFGVSVTDAQLESVAAMVVAYLVQSGAKSAVEAHAEAVAANPIRSMFLNILILINYYHNHSTLSE